MAVAAEITVDPEGLTGNTGAMIALYPSPEVARRLALAGGDPWQALHCTLVYLGKAAQVADVRGLLALVSDWAAETPPLHGEVSGIGVFTGGPKPVTYRSVDLPQLPAAREGLVSLLDQDGRDVPKTHGFTPHITLAYADRRDADASPSPVLFSQVSVVLGDERWDFALAGSLLEGLEVFDLGAMTRVDGPNDDDMLLDQVATAVMSGPVHPGRDGAGASGSVLPGSDSTAPARDGLMESIHFDEHKHPRWPKGTPGGLGGQFMEAGQRFHLEGKDWEIYQILPDQKGGIEIIANEDSGKVGAVQQRVFKTKAGPDGSLTLPGVTRPPTKVLKGSGKYSDLSNMTIVNPYVDASSHDPSLPKPPHIDLSDEEWKRFGREDQLTLIALQKKLGAWSPGKTQTAINQTYKAYSQTIQDIVRNAYSSQYGASSGHTLSLSSLFKGGFTKGKTMDEVGRLREQAMELMADHRSVIQWDLYNRTHAPDVALIHRTNEGGAKWKQRLEGMIPIFPGLSQSWHYSPTFLSGFGTYGVATPTAIRYIQMSTYSASAVSNGFASEQEVSVAAQMKLDPKHSFFWNASQVGPATKWLTQTTQNEPQPGWVLDQFRKAQFGGDASALPVLPAPASIQMQGAGGKGWVKPPAWATTGVEKMAFVKSKSGEPLKKPANALDLQPGDFIQGLQGTRYLILADPNDPYGLGLAYYKVTDKKFDETGKIVGNVGGSDVGSAYNFESGGVKEFYKLDAHVDLPQIKEHKTSFDPQGWLNGKDKHYTGKLKKGAIFKVNGVPYMLTEDGSGTYDTVAIQNLESGKPGSINGNYMTAVLVPKPGYKPPEGGPVAAEPEPQVIFGTFSEPQWEQGQWVAVHGTNAPTSGLAHVVSVEAESQTALVKWDGTGNESNVPFDVLKAVPNPVVDKPQAGSIFSSGGKKWVVTNILKSGTVKAKPWSGGPVQALPADAKWMHDPEQWKIGPKTKLKTLEVGEKVHVGGGVKTQHPYVVTAKYEGTHKVRLTSVETGESSVVGWNKSYRKLVSEEAPAPDIAAVGSQPTMTPKGLLKEFVPEEWVKHGHTLVGEMEVGDYFLGTDGKTVYQLKKKPTVEKKIPGSNKGLGTAKNMMTGKPYTALAPEKTFMKLGSKAEEGVPYEELKPGDPVQLKDLKVGDAFQPSDSALMWEVTAEATGGTFVKGKVAGGAIEQEWPPTEVVKFSTHVDPSKPVDITALPPAIGNGFVPYKAATSGKPGVGKGVVKNEKLQTLPAGTVFTDKNGALWKLKKNGANSVITDGEKLFKAHGGARVQVSSLSFDDTSPELVGVGGHGNVVEAPKVASGKYKKGDIVSVFDGTEDGVDAKIGVLQSPGKWWVHPLDGTQVFVADEQDIAPAETQVAAPENAPPPGWHYAKNPYAKMGDLTEGVHFVLPTAAGGLLKLQTQQHPAVFEMVSDPAISGHVKAKYVANASQSWIDSGIVASVHKDKPVLVVRQDGPQDTMGKAEDAAAAAIKDLHSTPFEKLQAAYATSLNGPPKEAESALLMFGDPVAFHQGFGSLKPGDQYMTWSTLKGQWRGPFHVAQSLDEDKWTITFPDGKTKERDKNQPARLITITPFPNTSNKAAAANVKVADLPTGAKFTNGLAQFEKLEGGSGMMGFPAKQLSGKGGTVFFNGDKVVSVLPDPPESLSPEVKAFMEQHPPGSKFDLYGDTFSVRGATDGGMYVEVNDAEGKYTGTYDTNELADAKWFDAEGNVPPGVDETVIPDPPKGYTVVGESVLGQLGGGHEFMIPGDAGVWKVVGGYPGGPTIESPLGQQFVKADWPEDLYGFTPVKKVEATGASEKPLSKFEKGESFVLGGHEYKVIGFKWTSDKEGNTKVLWVEAQGPNGGLIQFNPSAKAKSLPKPGEVPPAATPAEAGSKVLQLPSYASAWGSGGKYKHKFLDEMVAGQTFYVKGSTQIWQIVATDYANYVLVKKKGAGTETFLVPRMTRVRPI